MSYRRYLRLILSMLNNFKLRLKHNKIHFTTEMRGKYSMRNCSIGKYCYIGSGCSFLNAIIENYCSIASNVTIGGMEHPIHDLSTNTWLSDKGDDTSKTYIGPDVWIATGSIIRQGVKIGKGAVVGANSFVNKDVPPYAIVVGSPATIIKYRFNEELIHRLQKSEYHFVAPTHAKEIIEEIRREFNVL